MALRLPTPVVLVLWGYSLWRVFRSGYLQEALVKAKDYVRPIKF